MSSRDEILGRVRAGLGRNRTNLQAALERVDTVLAARTHGPKPMMDGEREVLVHRFREKSEASSCTVEVVDRQVQVPAAVAAYLTRMQLPSAAVVQPALAMLDWASAGLTVDARGAQDADLVGITSCFCAVAETGSLMLCSAPDTPAAVSLLPETHIAIVNAHRVVPHMEDAWALARTELGALPRAVNFVSGPSRTGDIELTIVLGAHGPYRVHLVIVSEAP